MLVILLQIIFVLACFFLVIAVLMQTGKGGGISGAFGIGGASQTIFGASGAGNVLTRATWILGGAFMLLSLLLAMLSGTSPATRTRSVLEPVGTAAPVTAPSGTPADAGLPAPGSSPASGTETPPAGTVSPAPVTTPPPGTSGATGQ